MSTRVKHNIQTEYINRAISRLSNEVGKLDPQLQESIDLLVHAQMVMHDEMQTLLNGTHVHEKSVFDELTILLLEVKAAVFELGRMAGLSGDNAIRIEAVDKINEAAQLVNATRLELQHKRGE